MTVQHPWADLMREFERPPAAARRTAAKAPDRVQVREYPVDHFDVYGGVWHEWMLADQISFLTEILTPSVTTASRHRIA